MPITINFKKTYNDYKYYFGELIKLSVPVLIGELGHILTGVADVAVISRYSTLSLASVSIANSILFTIFIFGLGIQNAISIILSKKRGEKEQTESYFFCCFIYSAILSVIFTLISLLTIPVTDLIGIEPELIPDIKKYISIVAFSMPGIFIFQGLKEFLQSFEIVKFPNLVLLVSVAVNFTLNLVFVFGYSIIPEMGVTGAALATTIVRTLSAIALIIFYLKIFKTKFEMKPGFMFLLTKTGLPIGAAWMLEFLAFNIITVLVGRTSALLSASHSILTTISSSTFAFTSAIAIALCVKTAFHWGENHVDKVKKFYIAALLSGVGFMAFASLVFALFPYKILGIFTKDIEVIKIAHPIIAILAAYQVFDGFQTITGGILKGFKKTGIVSFSVIAGYWLVGAPAAYILVGLFDLSLKGYWIALAVSLLVIGLIQAVVAEKMLKSYSQVQKAENFAEALTPR